LNAFLKIACLRRERARSVASHVVVLLIAHQRRVMEPPALRRLHENRSIE
jgi:hypothetical protein